MQRTFRRRPIDVQLPPYGVFVLESRHGPDFRMAGERHDFLEIFCILGGAGAVHVDRRRHRCGAGDVVVVPAGATHRLEDDPDDPLSLYGVCVAPHVWRYEPDLPGHLGAGPLPVGALLSAQTRADLRRLLYEQTLAPPGSRAWIVGQTLQLLVVLARSRLSEPRHPAEPECAAAFSCRGAVRRYLAELPHRFFEPSDLDQTAGGLGMSRKQFTELFREATGCSWLQYRTRLRIDHARQLLAESGRSITAVAFECGFEDLSSFYKAFKRLTGLPPHAWRQRQGRHTQAEG